MLVSFRIKNFMSFKTDTLFTLEPDPSITQSEYDICESNNLLKVSAIFGANASGKSTLLKALQTLCAIIAMDYDKYTVNELVIPFAFSTDTDPVEFEILFRKESHEYHYGISFLNNEVSEEFLYIDDAEFMRRDSENTHLAESLSLYTNIAQPWFSFMGTFRKLMPRDIIPTINEFYNFFLNDIFFVRDYISDYVKQSMNEKMFNDAAFRDEVLNLVSRIDVGISGFTFAPIVADVQQKNLRTVHLVYDSDGVTVSRRELELSDESNGTVKFIYYAAIFIMVLRNNSTLCVDELSSALHPLLTRYLVEYFCKHSRSAQLIFTSHDAFLMDSFLRKDEINILTKSKIGATTLSSLADYENSESNLKLSTKYLHGHFAGIPDIKGDFDET